MGKIEALEAALSALRQENDLLRAREDVLLAKAEAEAAKTASRILVDLARRICRLDASHIPATAKD